ncbi:DUF3095 family protein [Gracilimonas amylolytica]|uniref:DUF3095 family protein n=1 Tax=Gracilimonas amylolytica TaxID=1749045 RepID=UPI000CD89153|nr:DUF3095 family protein [Gracilimonas amylolytica]
MRSREFYNSLNVVTTFRDVSKPEVYTSLPDDSYLAIADVRGSTDAIRLGKYKEVNMAGASIIAALNNFYSENDLLPYLFGGDGSLLVLPDHGIDTVKGILAFCKEAVKNAYGLEMSVGVVSMKELRDHRHDVGVARLKLSEFIDQTIFWGSGVTYAEDLVKEKNRLEGVAPVEADLSGLECRWNQISSDKDEVAAYLIQAVGTDSEQVRIYEACFGKIEEIYGMEEDYHPVREEALSMTANPSLLGVEWKLRTQPPTLLKKARYILNMIFELVTGVYLMRFNKKTSQTNWGDYKPDLVRHADYKKFGDGLRFVASGTIAQRMQLTEFLEDMFREGKLAYGVHPSFAAMVTCYVRNYQHNHIHFVDGSNGGYAKASQDLKLRRKKLRSSDSRE